MLTGNWDPATWSAFWVILGSCLIALTLTVAAVRTVRGWTAPAGAAAQVRRSTARPAVLVRPTVELAARRAPAWAIEAGYDITGELARVVAEEGGLDDDTSAHLAPGAGSLASLREVGPGALLAAEPVVDPEVRAWFDAAFRPIMEDFRIATEASMRKARLWELRGQEGNPGAQWARVELDHWRMESATGEIPNPFTAPAPGGDRCAALRELAH